MDYETGKWLEQIEIKIANIEAILIKKFPDIEDKPKKD